MSGWKAAGISYVQYANICARAVRNALKDELRTPALARNENGLKFVKWEKGVQSESVS
ncbi:mitochondrial ATP synthase epsilon chain-domain-containing protein [Halteromyces radiatus]|uniref:mitochondrial ATP synthase epsilon chain-domain-containing protein n=1 Tax=Halteromyces radiatus TaxID=101107 RepID=UPI00221EBCE0|nr:mitochondrial ATP synthase epsilon chain-domain-containing protein [Halteromyces radiatus]KAI8076796.1 mitochondrial ATP synthase epsilon chain-domain-containing protein [Halteromyces radiatus]